MIDGALLNHIMVAFSIALDGAFAALTVYSIGLLSAFGLLHFYLSMSLGLTGYIPIGEALARFLWTIVKIGIFYWLMTSLYDLIWNGAFRTFMVWGQSAGGGGFGEASFLDPATIVQQGFAAAYPIKLWVDQFIGPTMVFYLVDVAIGTIAYHVTVASFSGIALAVMMAVIEFKLALATAAVLLPFAIFTHTAFLGELSISWLVTGLVRILVTAILMGIALPLFTMLTLPTPTVEGPDPTAFQALSLGFGALVFAVLAWVIPNRAASIGGRGVALALTGADIATGGMAGVSAARYLGQIGGGAIRGVSRLAA
jgi:type IV secretion system protein TrbL